MTKTVRVKVNTQARRTSNGNIQVRTSVSNGHTTRTTTKTIRVKQVLLPNVHSIGHFYDHHPLPPLKFNYLFLYAQLQQEFLISIILCQCL